MHQSIYLLTEGVYNVSLCVAVCCSVLQCVAVCCSGLARASPCNWVRWGLGAGGRALTLGGFQRLSIMSALVSKKSLSRLVPSAS